MKINVKIPDSLKQKVYDNGGELHLSRCTFRTENNANNILKEHDFILQYEINFINKLREVFDEFNIELIDGENIVLGYKDKDFIAHGLNITMASGNSGLIETNIDLTNEVN